MQIRVLFLALAAAVAATPLAGAQELRAKATIAGEGITGTVELREVDAQTSGLHDQRYMTGMKAVEITATVNGLKPGAHGFHIHAVGTCQAPFTSAGGHFDPGPSGAMDPDANHPFHMGDLPNLVADANGHATLKTVTTRVTLSPGPLSIFDPDGTALIVHADADQGVTGASKSGLSGGGRIACGVVTRQ